jgi:hypothetical protein
MDTSRSSTWTTVQWLCEHSYVKLGALQDKSDACDLRSDRCGNVLGIVSRPGKGQYERALVRSDLIGQGQCVLGLSI